MLDHPQAATVLVLGILGAATFGLLAPIAWAMGGRVVREIDASGGHLGGRGPAQAGRVPGMVSTLLFGASLAGARPARRQGDGPRPGQVRRAARPRARPLAAAAGTHNRVNHAYLFVGCSLPGD